MRLAVTDAEDVGDDFLAPELALGVVDAVQDARGYPVVGEPAIGEGGGGRTDHPEQADPVVPYGVASMTSAAAHQILPVGLGMNQGKRRLDVLMVQGVPEGVDKVLMSDHRTSPPQAP